MGPTWARAIQPGPTTTTNRKGETVKRNTQTTTVHYIHENESLGYVAELRLLVAIHPGDPGDWTTPPTPDEFELLDVEAENITCEAYSHIFGPKDTAADMALAAMVESAFRAAYDVDSDSVRDVVEFDAAQRFADGATETISRIAHLNREILAKPF